MNTLHKILGLAILNFVLVSAQGYSQTSLPLESDSIRQATINVFIDCSNCDFDYIRTEIPYVNYVRDRFESDVHILVTELSTGGGGNEYTFEFIGMNKFAGMYDTIKYYSQVNNTGDEIRKGIVHTLELGFTRYLARTPLANYLSINYGLNARPESVKDKWHHWVFTVSPSIQFSNSTPSDDKYFDSNINISSGRITNAMKTRISASGSYNEHRPGNGHLQVRRSWDLSFLQAWSLNNKWSAGFWGSGSDHSSPNNHTYQYRKSSAAVLATTIEYDIFPYSESTNRLLEFDYSLGGEYMELRPSYSSPYQNNSPYSKWQSITELSAIVILIRPWGNLNASFSERQYFDNIDQNSQEIRGALSWKISQGLFLDFYSQWSRNHGFPRQLNISDRSFYSTNVGFSWMFGSIYNNIVNARMNFIH